MTDTSTNDWDYQATIISQYFESPCIVQWIENMAGYFDPSADLDQFFDIVFNIDTAVGYGLDIWGRILGVGRTLTVASSRYFGFRGSGGQAEASGDPFGGPGAHPGQYPFFSGGKSTNNVDLPDDGYRVLLLAKALANITDCSIPAINQILINLFLAPAVPGRTGNAYCTDGRNMTMTYTFDVTPPLTGIELAIIGQSGVLPRPAGVAATVVEL